MATPRRYPKKRQGLYLAITRSLWLPVATKSDVSSLRPSKRTPSKLSSSSTTSAVTPLLTLNENTTLFRFLHHQDIPAKMLRQQVVKLARANTTSFKRSFSLSTVRAAEGDTGGLRSGGSASSYVRQLSQSSPLQGHGLDQMSACKPAMENEMAFLCIPMQRPTVMNIARSTC